ncbi:hypothetical protein RM572_27115 [Streptomyces sp. DSM 42041]|uniref:Uncharacterized protein n=1 Tax=Streptomyces hazeniae TaxID=3075538 RepID=A0ABU2NZN0_9ACTN|nr:hypothetical protein [Streptomyces sp. DSM 42041]MDT0382434.1 hypothetical protein [Streptomyces sp. DSM 42041]
MTWTEGRISRRPATKRIKKPEEGLPYPVWAAAREKGTWERMSLTNEDPTTKDISNRFRDLAQPHLRPQHNEVARRAEFTYLRLARVVSHQHAHRVYYVIPTAAAPYVLTLPSQQRIWQIAAAALGAVAALTCLLWLLV